MATARVRWLRLGRVALACAVVACGGSETSDPDPDAAMVDGDSEWQTLASIASGPVQETAVLVLRGRIYVVAGIHEPRGTVGDLISYDPDADAWATHASLPIGLHHVNAAVAGDRIYVLGGLQPDFGAVPDSFVYDPDADAWSEISPMPAGTERGSCATGAIDGIIYLAGGTAGGPVDAVSSYDPTLDQWTTGLRAMPVGRHHGVGVVADGKLYAVAGRGQGIASISDRVDAYDPATDTWSQKAPIPTARGGIAGALVGGEIVVVGGEGNSADPDGVFAAVEAYDVATDTWRRLPAMPTPRHGMGAAGIDPYLYVPGGATVQGFGATDVHSRLKVVPADE